VVVDPIAQSVAEKGEVSPKGEAKPSSQIEHLGTLVEIASKRLGRAWPAA
jgi:hypothetical protein